MPNEPEAGISRKAPSMLKCMYSFSATYALPDEIY